MHKSPIHKSATVHNTIDERVYKCIPPYSLFLNIIEEYWFKMICAVKRTLFDMNEYLTSILMEPSTKVTLNDSQG